MRSITCLFLLVAIALFFTAWLIVTSDRDTSFSAMCSGVGGNNEFRIIIPDFRSEWICSIQVDH